MKKNYLFLATAAVLMASCANDDFSGDNTSSPTGTGAIAFNMNTPAMSRADGSTTTENAHAKALGNEFIVWGEKNENNSGKQADDADVVFKNYRVQYTASSANTTESNTKDWEYVGITPYTIKVQLQVMVLLATRAMLSWLLLFIHLQQSRPSSIGTSVKTIPSQLCQQSRVTSRLRR